jgi:Lon protease-like protein
VTTIPVQIPSEIPIIVLSQVVLFPNSLLPLHIFEERYRSMLTSSLDGPRIFGVAQTLEYGDPNLAVPDLAEIMGIGVIRACVGRPDGTSDLILQGLTRVKIVGEIESEPFRIVEIAPLITEQGDPTRILELADLLRAQSRHLVEHGYQMPAQMAKYLESIRDPEIICDLLASSFVRDADIRQEILETEDLESRLEITLEAMKVLLTL